VNTTNNKNHQINVSNVSSTGCGHSAPGDIFVPAEIRHVEILDSSGAVMAVMGVTP